MTIDNDSVCIDRDDDDDHVIDGDDDDDDDDDYCPAPRCPGVLSPSPPPPEGWLRTLPAPAGSVQYSTVQYSYLLQGQ
jgi:hypothetical protein